MPSLGAWAMSGYMAAAEHAEEEVPTASRDEEGNASAGHFGRNAEDGEARVGEAPETRVGEAAKEAAAPLSVAAEMSAEDATRDILPAGDATSAPSDDATGEKRKTPETKTAGVAAATTKPKPKPKRAKNNAAAAPPSSPPRRSARARGKPPG
jgi:hypothetical protein